MEKRKLADLPNELLTQILSNIFYQDQLAMLTLVSKQFKTLVEPLLYRHISLDVRYSAKDLHSTRIVSRFSFTTIPRFECFDRLVDKLSVHQDLGQSVQTLSLRVHRRLWYHLFDTHFRLLKRMPRLKALSLSPPPLRSIIPSSDWALESLRLDFSHVTDHYHEVNESVNVGVPLHIIARHLWQPRLRKIQAEKVSFMPYLEKTFRLPIGTSSVDDLRFLECDAINSDCVVAAFLRSIKRLKCFVVEFSRLPYWTAVLEPNTGVLELALSGHSESIEELAVAFSEDPRMMDWRLGPFTNWSSLKRLAVPGYMILNLFPGMWSLHETLPPLLEEVQIEHPMDLQDRILPRSLQQLAENKDVYVPRLIHVIWWYAPPVSDHLTSSLNLYLANMMGSSSAFEKVGVKFEWYIEPFFRDTPFGKRLCGWEA